MISEPHIAVIIPCYNESLTIEKVIKDFKFHLPNADIVVCDNNSSDGTFEIAKNAGAIVIKEPKQGKTNAVLKLFDYVDADIYMMVDGDDTYPANQAQSLIKIFQEKELDMMVGDRLSNKTYLKENKRKFHSFGNDLVKRLINSLFKSDLKDILSGYRIFSKKFVKNYTTLVQGFELETDLTIFCLNYNLNIGEASVEYRDRPANSHSKLNTFSDGFKVIKTVFSMYRFYKPLKFFSFLAGIVFISALPIGFFPVYEYIEYKYVYKVPSFIFSTILVLTSLLLFVTGLILDSMMKIDRKSTILKIRK